MTARKKKEKTEEKPEVKVQVEETRPVEPVKPKKVVVTPEELAKLQADGKLVGYDPATREATIKGD